MMKICIAFLLALFFLAACGGGDADAPAANGTADSGPLLGVADAPPTGAGNADGEGIPGVFEYQREAVPIVTPAPPHPFFDHRSVNAVVITPPIYYAVQSFFNGMAAIMTEVGIGFVDSTGAVVVPVDYIGAGAFIGDVSYVMRADYTIVFIDRTGRELFSLPDGVYPVTLTHLDPCEEGFFIVAEWVEADTGAGQWLWGMVDDTGFEVIPRRFNNIFPFRDGRARVQYGVRWGFIDVYGEMAVEPRFHWAFDFVDGAAVVEEGALAATRRASIIDIYGRELGVLAYPLMSSFSGGLGRFHQRFPAGQGFVNTLGQVVIPPIFFDARDFSEGLAAAQLTYDGYWGFIDGTGHWVVQPQFLQVRDFSDGMAAVAVHDANEQTRWGFINTAGETTIIPVFAWVDDFHEGFAVVNLEAEIYYPRWDSELWQGVVGVPWVVGGIYTLIDHWGREVLDLSQFDMLGQVSEGVLVINEGWQLGGTPTGRYIAEQGLWGFLRVAN